MRTYNFLGKEITLQEEAVLEFIIEDNHPQGHAVYRALAQDGEGNEYLVDWLPRHDFLELDDGSAFCDWENPWRISKI